MRNDLMPASLRLNPDGPAIPLDMKTIFIIAEHIPLERQYDGLALFMQPDQDKHKNLLKTRRQRERGQFRPKKDPIEKYERLDDLYFTLCDLCHEPFPGSNLYDRLWRYFKPHNIPELTLQLVDQLLLEKDRVASRKNDSYTLRVKKGLQSPVLFRTKDATTQMDLALIWALIHSKTGPFGEEYQYPPDLIDAIVEVGEPELVKDIVSAPGIRLETLDRIWNLYDCRLMVTLAGKTKFVANLTDGQAQDILELGHDKLLLEFSGTFLWDFANYDSASMPRLSQELHARLKTRSIAIRKKYHRGFPDSISREEIWHNEEE